MKGQVSNQRCVSCRGGQVGREQARGTANVNSTLAWNLPLVDSFLGSVGVLGYDLLHEHF